MAAMPDRCEWCKLPLVSSHHGIKTYSCGTHGPKGKLVQSESCRNWVRLREAFDMQRAHSNKETQKIKDLQARVKELERRIKNVNPMYLPRHQSGPLGQGEP